MEIMVKAAEYFQLGEAAEPMVWDRAAQAALADQ
jgi:hypothetical protein